MKERIVKGSIQFCLIFGISAFFISACENKEDTKATLPLSLNEVMVALVNQAADPI